MKPIGALVFTLLALAISATSAQNPLVLDTAGQPLRRGVEYLIKPAITEAGGPFTLVDRDDLCPLYVGQRNVSADGIPVTFEPFDESEDSVRESRNSRIVFSITSSRCADVAAWMVGRGTAVSADGRRLIIDGLDPSTRVFANYFLIRREGSYYRIEWCPSELCPTCTYQCGSLGSLFENGQRFAALDGNALPLVFERVQV